MEERIARGKAIRLKCLDCCCGNSAEVRRCPATNCPLWRYRMGSEKKAEALQTSAEAETEEYGYTFITTTGKNEKR
ncbi:MAG: hypothetical protein E7462_00695 [Ruminococcaceae bacterium]|nr:hypothetical protein [Oscillospiraceae bacterium]